MSENNDLRKEIAWMIYNGKEGHIPSAYSIVDMIDYLYDNFLKFDPKNPKWSERDYFILSKVQVDGIDPTDGTKSPNSRLADPLIQEAIKLGHNDNGFYRKIGLFFEQKGDHSSAVKYLKMSLDIDASWASTHYDLARVYQKLGQTNLKIEHLKEALLCSHNKDVDYVALNKRLRFLTQNEGG